MRPVTAATIAFTAAAALGCIAIPGEGPYRTLDFVIDRPRVLAIRLDPVIVAHRRAVRVEALALAPGGATPDGWRLDRCALRDDLPTAIRDIECFGEPALVVPLADTLPASFDPPDLSDTRCDPPDTGLFARRDPLDTDEDTGVVLQPYEPCDSQGPIRVTARFGAAEAQGTVFVTYRRDPWQRWERPPTPIHAAVHGFRGAPEIVAPGEAVPLTYTIGARVIDFRWYVDAGVLAATGVTTAQRLEGGLTITTNTLEVPADHHGPLRVVVVAQGALPGDMTWDVITLSVP